MKDRCGSAGVGGVPDTFNMYDIATGCKYSVPVSSLETFEVYTALNQVKGRDRIKNVFCDNYSSYKRAIRELRATYEPSQPGVHHSNAVIERQNLDNITYGTRVLLCAAGLPACFWP